MKNPVVRLSRPGLLGLNPIHFLRTSFIWCLLLCAGLVCAALTSARAQATAKFSSNYAFGGDLTELDAQALVQGGDGNVYGTVNIGGDYGQGSVYRVSPDGTPVTVYSFRGGDDGSSPTGNLLVGNDGSLYGLTTVGSSYPDTIFRLLPNGTLQTIHRFGDNEGGSSIFLPTFALAQDTAGNLYGTAAVTSVNKAGRTVSFDCVYQVSPAGALMILHRFSIADGVGSLIPALVGTSDGHVYGLTQGNGSTTASTFYRLLPDGTCEYVSQFSGVTFLRFMNVLIQGRNGNFYGTATGGEGAGVVFRLTPDGQYRTVCSFEAGSPPGSLLAPQTPAGAARAAGPKPEVIHGNDLTPTAQLIQGSDGNLYGLTRNNFYGDNAALYQVTMRGEQSFLVDFRTSDNARPYGLAQSADGHLYVTTATGFAGAALSGLVVTDPPKVRAVAVTPELGVNTGGIGRFRVMRLGDSDLSRRITVYYVLSGTAHPGRDFVAPSGSVTIEPGHEGATVFIEPEGHLHGLASREIKLTVLPGAGYFLAPGSSAAMSLVND